MTSPRPKKPVVPRSAAETKSEPPVARAAARDAMREKLMFGLMGLITTGLIGGSLTTWIQQRAWTWQNRVAGIDKDVGAATSVNKAASELINLRWLAAYRMTRALEREAGDSEWKQAREDFDAADKQWALQYSNIARDVEFNVDGPFGVDSADLSKVWTAECAKAKRAAPFDTQSARVLLEIVNHCHGQLKTSLDPLVEGDADKRRMTKANKDLIDAAYRRLDHLYRLDDVFRCVTFDRAVAIRNATAQQSYWGRFFGVAPAHYSIGRSLGDCDR